MADTKTGRINPQVVEYQRPPVRLLHFAVSSSPGICCRGRKGRTACNSWLPQSTLCWQLLSTGSSFIGAYIARTRIISG